MQNSMNVTREQQLEAAGNAVFRQLAEEEAGFQIELDPDLAEFMGAFEETALNGEEL
jgi:hypothetical protein